ncbi:Cytochrome bd-I ubiquinol oxidase subunit 2 [Rubripirellula lacrimiformis]|uniref:Cytochrome bd-I ubiquinol oxidase subunit 2 n=1 Tax=Rubripirellula lacrimiformis TaxID=1930273 RepID=A0A517N3F3_9BACT|nr:cytochrome d ubiquinol oxidase subunit II [Rubripirellula lacrimiformis]QDT01669.1 Cytochrome bd-I ubiquinol oxidase subunit 2 [Rubripirellula lacrimiformis]
MNYELLTFIWFLLLGVLLTGYAILDGFDLGVGILHPFIAKDDRERRLVMNSIGPLWDGNEVWLVTFGGALFAAFPVAYATVFSSFYTAFYLLLTCLIGRAVSLEFRSKVHSPTWRKVWDVGFFLSSFTAAFLLGVAGGNVMAGMELGPKYEYQGNLLSQIYWYPLMVGCLTVSLFALHGAIFLYLKTEDELQDRIRKVITKLFYVFAVLYLVVSVATFVHVPHATENIANYPILWIVPLLNALAVLNIPRAMHLGKPGYAFFTSSMVIAALATLFSVAIFPNFMLSTLDPAYNVTLDNARSSQGTLQTMLIIAVIGMPCVASYTVIIYWIFRGKVKLDSNSY